MKKIILGLGLLLSLEEMYAMNSANLETEKENFLSSRNIGVSGNTTDFYGKTISILKKLQSDKRWRPSPEDGLDDQAAKQSAANIIEQLVDNLIRDKKYGDAEVWLEVETAFTQDEESISSRQMLLSTMKNQLTTPMQQSSFSTFGGYSMMSPWGDLPFLFMPL